MIKVNPDYQNISNYFVDTDNITEDLSQVMSKLKDSVFGLELSYAEGVMDKMIITPPYVRLDQRNVQPYRECPTEEFTPYEGYLSEPHFMPLYGALEGKLFEDLANLEVHKNDKVCIQWLFKRKYGWQEQAFEMYESYLLGNGNPAKSRIGRRFQSKVLGMLDRVIPVTHNDYVDEVEEKLLMEGFQFQLRIAVKSEQEARIKEQLVSIFSEYDSYNSLKLCKVRDKEFTSLYSDCIMTGYTHNQIISKKELFSLIGGELVSEHTAPEIAKPISISNNNALELLPVNRSQAVEPDETLVTRIAKALVRVKLIERAQLYDPVIASGARLTVVQSKIPGDLIITDIEKKVKAIQAVLNVDSLNISRGDGEDKVKFVLPNKDIVPIGLRELLEMDEFKEFAAKVENALAFAVGVDEFNNPIYLSLSRLVHMLISGSTNSGKSVCINSIVISLIVTYPPEILQFIMIDPATVEMTQYEGFPHVQKVITDMSEAASELDSLSAEMDRRYKILGKARVKNILEYNKKMDIPMPFLVCVIDEYADLHMTNPEVDEYIGRLGQKARKVGIHLIIATQRPSAKVLDGDIKANLQNVLCFNLGTNNNYKTVFGEGIGNTQLLGYGDGMMRIVGDAVGYRRFQGAMISPNGTSEEEIYNSLREYYSGNRVNTPIEEPTTSTPASVTESAPVPPSVPNPDPVTDEVPEEEEPTIEVLPLENNEEDPLYKLKQYIATTRETRSRQLREHLGIKGTKLTELMSILVEEGWLEKTKSKGYQIIASDSLLSEWKE
ncbi:FtsK/SpoIIIE-like protein [Bacillus phage vB_BmeM-Goe8]|uniref:FtsK/SpoIIIE protein n=1 Tax=Bacillus phage vB_BmeM-Goe8 TaxID=2593638 RepID=A0A516KN14_9CAUD|nr:FtsK/SpoIIIE-like protein [Bacillus phage vB_BmeM-Goe8]QDP42967.1 FtsK/SpoIIIE protein [Bacillus phage vB_BmeM-Goe8]